MSPEQIAAIERLRELDRRVGYWQWGQDEQFSHHVLYDDGFCFSVCETDSADALPTHAEFIVTLRNEALPLIEALQQALSEAQADARVFSGSYNALAEDFGRLKEENERLRDLLKDACADLGRMTLLRDKFYCEMETAQTETVFAKKEIERLRAGIAKAVYALGNSEPYADKLNEALKDSPDFGLQLLVDGFYQALEALHDA